MDYLKKLERTLFGSENNNGIYYPDIDEEYYEYMVIEFIKDENSVKCFPLFRRSSERVYIDIYIWDVLLPSNCKRFILEKGYSLTEEDEELFLNYLHSDILVEDDLYRKMVEMVNLEYPEIHLQCYLDWRQTLQHVYFTFHRTGPYEILFKANLNHLAFGLDSMNEYNLIGSSPERIFDVQMGMLRALNSAVGSEIMASVENREIANCLYSKFHNIICGSMINKYQWRYMKGQQEVGENIDKQMYHFLGSLSCDKQYYTYLRYIEQKTIVDEYYSNLSQYPDVKRLNEYSEICDTIEWCIEHEREINNRLIDKERKYREMFTYQTSDYIVLMPSCLREILAEAQNQHNCLYKYVLKMACNNSIILFMREKGNEKESLITIEVEDGVIKQALRSFNHAPYENQRIFLEEYASQKNLVLCPEVYEDWGDEDWGDEDWEDEGWEDEN